MDALRDDLLKNKHFVTILAALVLVGGVVWFINYNSVESQCERYVERLGSLLNVPGDNALRNVGRQTVMRQSIEECIRRDGP